MGDAGAFHEETGYWLRDAAAKQVLRCLIVPRGVTVLAGGTVEPDATSFQIAAVAGSDSMASARINFWIANSKRFGMN
ncbi:MAG: heme-binding beta-barrel domain-containing protein [Nitrospira sp.]